MDQSEGQGITPHLVSTPAIPLWYWALTCYAMWCGNYCIVKDQVGTWLDETSPAQWVGFDSSGVLTNLAKTGMNEPPPNKPVKAGMVIEWNRVNVHTIYINRHPNERGCDAVQFDVDSSSRLSDR